MEKPWLDGRINYALHWDGYGKAHRSEGKLIDVPGVMDGFHTFALLWLPDEYVFYVDGKEMWRTRAGGVCQAPLYIKLSDEVGDWGGDIATAKLPDRCTPPTAGLPNRRGDIPTRTVPTIAPSCSCSCSVAQRRYSYSNAACVLIGSSLMGRSRRRLSSTSTSTTKILSSAPAAAPLSFSLRPL